MRGLLLAAALALLALAASRYAPFWGAPGPAASLATMPSSTPGTAPDGAGLAVATFAGGCFWCVEEAFEAVDGVSSAESGYTGGAVPEPTYEQVTEGTTGHYEAVRVFYDPRRLSYEKLLEVFWRNVDPTDALGQFCDKGPQYRSAIFWHDEEQREAAEGSRKALQESGRLGAPIVTEVLRASTFYPAEEYHQDYAQKNPIRYHFYRRGCGRDARLEEVWEEG